MEQLGKRIAPVGATLNLLVIVIVGLMAAETYDPLVSYRSWSGLVGRFLTDDTLGPYSRVLRP